MFGPWLSQLGSITYALVHMKKKKKKKNNKNARIPYTFVCRPSLPWTKLDHHRLPMAGPNAAQCKGNNWADNFQWGSERDKILFSHAPFIRPGYCLLSLWKFFISVRSRQIRANTFFRIWTSAKIHSISNAFDNLIGYILSISMCMQNFITISYARSCQYQCLCKSLSKYSTQFKR